jgi:hypothetical protein
MPDQLYIVLQLLRMNYFFNAAPLALLTQIIEQDYNWLVFGQDLLGVGGPAVLLHGMDCRLQIFQDFFLCL